MDGAPSNLMWHFPLCQSVLFSVFYRVLAYNLSTQMWAPRAPSIAQSRGTSCILLLGWLFYQLCSGPNTSQLKCRPTILDAQRMLRCPPWTLAEPIVSLKFALIGGTCTSPQVCIKTGSIKFYLKYLPVCFFQVILYFVLFHFCSVQWNFKCTLLFDIWTNSFSKSVCKS